MLLMEILEEGREASEALGRFMRSSKGKGIQPMLDVGRLYKQD